MSDTEEQTRSTGEAAAVSPADRRPLNSRSWPVMRRLATALAKRRVSPNMISIVGMCAGIGAGVCLALTARVEHEGMARALFLLAAACVQTRLLCNLIDGMVAVEGGMKSAVGDVYNEVPDRVSDVCTLVGAGYAVAGAATMGWAAALLAVMTAYVRAVGKHLTGASDYRGPMAKQQRMFVVTVACVGHAALPVSWTVWIGEGRVVTLMTVGLWVIAVGAAVTCARRLMRVVAVMKGRGA